MAQGISPNEKQNAQDIYGDIIDLPHWEPGSKHPRMSLHDRAAQFAPFAALVGYDEMVDEEARLTDREIELAESQKDLLDWQLNRINKILASGTRPELAFTYFIPDEKKAGGRYDTVTARVRRIDSANRKIFLLAAEGQDVPDALPFDRILSIQGQAVDGLDDDY